MTRTTFQPATGLNVLAAAWLQFEVHDWMNHAKAEENWELEPGMPVPKSLRGPGPVNYISGETHWWDASQLYGSKALFSRDVRADHGEIMVDGDLLRDMEQAIENANSPEANLWVGLAVLHILFAHEHNAIARRLREVYPHWDADRVYSHARLINSALMAKIHTVEWTPALIGHPTTVKAIKATWWGLLGPRARRRLGGTEIWTGIPGSRRDHHGVPYSLTEEFVTVYRMHPLVPDEFRVVDLAGRALGEFDLRGLAVQPGDTARPRERIEELGGAVNVLYSLGTSHPGQIELHNYPRVMQNWPRIALPPVDLAATDIVRTRETGVPRYNALRQALRRAPVTSFGEISARYGDEIREVYGGDLEAVDAVVGLYGEAKPPGFAFSETAFRVFLLMAARRLQSDRFFTIDDTPETYTPVGLRWIEETTMASMIRRHYPALAPALDGIENVFTPWRASTGR
jgi:hypothetical protein